MVIGPGKIHEPHAAAVVIWIHCGLRIPSVTEAELGDVFDVF